MNTPMLTPSQGEEEEKMSRFRFNFEKLCWFNSDDCAEILQTVWLEMVFPDTFW
jgi:hypothetical protein